MSVLFYTRVSFLSQPRYDPPQPSGFFKEDLPQKTFAVERDGARYEVTELPMILFPTVAGDLSIGEAKITVELDQMDGGGGAMDPFDPHFIQRFFGIGAAQTKVLSSKPVKIKALPLPGEGKPSDFSGAVGRFNLNASLDKTDLKVGDSLTLTVTVSGEGNIKSCPSPAYPKLDGTFRSYETEKSESISKAGDKITGNKTFKLLLIPQIPGNPRLTIPPVTFTYFDPWSRAYVRKQTKTLEVTVTGTPLEGAHTATAKESKILSEDIEFIVPDAPNHTLCQRVTDTVWRQRVPLTALPMAIWILGIAKGSLTKLRATHGSRPIKRLASAISKAKGAAAKGDAETTMNLLAPAFEAVIAQTLGLKSGKEPMKAMLARLKGKFAQRLSDEDFGSMKATLEAIEFLRFAPAEKAQREALLAEVIKQAGVIERMLRRLQ
mgnify:FL=1